MADELNDVIRESAAGPAEAEADGIRIKQHPLPDLLEADRHLRGRGAGANVGNVLSSMRAKLVPPGAG